MTEKPTERLNLIPGCLRRKFIVAFTTFEAVLGVVVLLECQKTSTERHMKADSDLFHRILRPEFTVALGTTRVRMFLIVVLVICVRWSGAISEEGVLDLLRVET